MSDIIVKDIKNGSEYYYGGSAEVSAEDVSYDNSSSGAVANNLQDAMDEVFQSVSNGKELIADAITDKGVSTSASDSFQTMATNIGLIPTATAEQIAAYNLVHNGNGSLIYTFNPWNVLTYDAEALVWLWDIEVYSSRWESWNNTWIVLAAFNKDWNFVVNSQIHLNVSASSWAMYIWTDKTKAYIYSYWHWSDSSHNPVPEWYTRYEESHFYTPQIMVDLTTWTVTTSWLPETVVYDWFYNSSTYRTTYFPRIEWRTVDTKMDHITLPYNIVDTKDWLTHIITATM